jgi:hypothetical protein
MAITAAEIVDAIKRRKSFDLSYRVTGSVHRNRICPPVLKAFAEEEPPDRPDDSRYITLEEFEALSLAARGKLLSLKRPKNAVGWSARFKRMKEVRAKDIVEGVKQAAEELGDAPVDRKLGLTLIGAYINGGLDLSHLKLPFSVRLICCAINGPIRVGRTDLVTLDLSGSAVRGVFGSFLRTRGSVRFRRLMSTSVVDLGGARVDDVLDASDAVVFPLDDPPHNDAFVGDRGIFNLSLAQLSNEARFIRTRIYGGLTLKGCDIKRSLFLDDAILRAPLAFLERLGADVVDSARDGRRHVETLPLAVRTSWHAEEKLAYELHDVITKEDAAGNIVDDADADPVKTHEQANRMSFETIASFPMAAELGARIVASGSLSAGPSRRSRLLQRLLMESPRARGTCLRADGLTVSGSVFARSIRSSGRVRCNYARITGSLHLDGARMRSAEDIVRGIEGVLAVITALPAADKAAMAWPEYVAFAQYQLDFRSTDLTHPSKQQVQKARRRSIKRERAENENFAFDIRGARIDGRLDLKPDERAGKRHAYDDLLGDKVTESLSLPNICRCEEFRKCRCKRSILSILRPKEYCACGAKEFECACAKLQQMWATRYASPIKAHVHCVYVNGQLALDGAVIKGDLNLSGILANLHNAGEYKRRLKDEYDDEQAFLRIEQCDIGGSLDLCDSIGVRGIEAQHVRVGARLRFAQHSVRLEQFKRHSLLLSGKMQFSDAKIGGDATFLFDKNDGPTLLLARSRIGGRLHILPAKDTEIVSRGGFKRQRLNSSRKDALSHTIPEIDLRAAHAAEIGHPDQAWPHPEYLRIEGFVYEQSTAYGPLTPRPPAHARKEPAKGKAEEQGASANTAQTAEAETGPQGAIKSEATRSEPAPQQVSRYVPGDDVWLFMAMTGFVLISVIALLARIGRLDWIDLYFGGANVALLAACMIGWGVQSLVAWHHEPKKKASEPRAIYWLGLQRAETSVYRRSGLTIPLQPYVQAGKVLRSAGLILSANLLEVDRLIRRNEQLSWRNNWPAKILLTLANVSTKYGFDPLRTIVIAVVIGSCAASVFHMADRGGYIRPTDGELMQLVAPPDGNLFAGMDCAAGPAGCAARAPPQYPSFSSLFFAFDVMTPGLDVGQEHYWRSSPVSVVSSRERSLWFELAAPIVKIIGWLLTTAIAISLLTRVEAMIARHEE